MYHNNITKLYEPLWATVMSKATAIDIINEYNPTDIFQWKQHKEGFTVRPTGSKGDKLNNDFFIAFFSFFFFFFISSILQTCRFNI